MKALIDIDALFLNVNEKEKPEIIKLIEEEKVLDYVAKNYWDDDIFFEIVRNSHVTNKTVNYIAGVVLKDKLSYPMTKSALRFSYNLNERMKRKLNKD